MLGLGLVCTCLGDLGLGGGADRRDLMVDRCTVCDELERGVGVSEQLGEGSAMRGQFGDQVTEFG
ncbi:hypothetical protein [Nocardia brasiliensis]|uniref:hypothetical protein n=1 Tax=Nocardia brasiliensis TaxID=37326 RepID=UPI002455457C|nr:hypothetical protein [Nocardia brasiliensis]